MSTRSCAPSSRCCRRPAATSTRCASRPRRSAASTTARRRASSTSSRSRPPPRSSSKSRSTPSSRRACSPRTSTRKYATRRSTPSRSRSRRATRLGLVNDRLADFVVEERPQAQRRHRRRARPRVRVLRPAHGLRPLPAQAPADAPRHRDAAAVLPAHRLRAGRDVPRGAGALPPVLVARVPAELADAVQRRHPPRAALELLPARLAATITSRASTSATPTSRMLSKFSRRHRPRVPPRALARLADREHERPLERHRAVAEDARRVGRGREPGRQAQGRVLRVPRAVARRHRGVPRAARQHRRRGEPHAQPEPRELDPRPVHAARRGGRRLEPVRSEGACRTLPDLYGEEFERAYAEAEAAGPRGADGQGARPLRADDADARADRQRLDDLQGQVEPRVQPDRRCPDASCTSRTSAPRSSRSRREDETAVCNLGSINLGAPRRVDATARRVRLRASSRATVRTAVRQLDRVIDLNYYPIESTAALEHALAPGRARR